MIGIVLVTVIALFVVLSNRIDLGFQQLDTRTRLGLDLQGGLQLVLQAEPTGNNPVTPDQLEAARNIMEDRAGGLGVAEPVVQTAEGNRILVELPGIDNPEDARRVIQETAFLEIVDGGDTPPVEGELICTTLGCPRPEQLRQPTATATSLPATAVVTGTTQVTGTVIAATPTTAITATGTVTGTVEAAPTPPSKTWTTIITGDEVLGSAVAVTFNEANIAQVSFTLQGAGPDKFRDFTQANVGRYMPILLDKRVISVPVIRGPIPGGQGVIEMGSGGQEALEDARVLAQQLKYGALPVGLTLQSERRISATLGQDAIDRSIVAGAIGLGMVVLFMVMYYRLPGLIASIALVIYALVTFAIFKIVPVTLTLAGIAGFILSIGMAVDANVLIFARLKEEIRAGKTLAAAVEAGFDHAWPSIRDSNASTLITCAILFWFGSTFGGASIIKGFALTLAIGVIVSLFSAILTSRTLLRFIVRTPLAQNKWAFNLETRRPAAGETAEA
jgi:preprotein translocase subunit SecD